MKYDYTRCWSALCTVLNAKQGNSRITLSRIIKQSKKHSLKILQCKYKLSNTKRYKSYNTQQNVTQNDTTIKHINNSQNSNVIETYNASCSDIPLINTDLQQSYILYVKLYICSQPIKQTIKIMPKVFLLLFISNSISQASRTQFFLGLGSSITEPKVYTDSKNQMTKNTSSVNESGGFYYNQEQLGNYEGNAKDIRSIYAGIETTIDDWDIFTVRGFISASYSNSVNFGNLKGVRNGNLRPCNQNELPTLTTICFRDQFPTSQPGVTVPLNTNPGFANSISSNALMLSYSAGADIGINIPIHVVIEKTSGYKIISLRVGLYLGGGYQFTSYSIGTYDDRTYSNQVPVFDDTNRSQIISNTRNDTLYAAGGGWFFHAGFNFYISNNLRIDIGAKLDSTARESSRWYLQQATSPPANPAPPAPPHNPVFFEQLLIQSHSIRMSPVWHVNMYVLF
ncbi:hypothetical protein LS73_002455 [Helicobacter muridarum]|nr:hypothetical protein [Helicobacter muridarum]TLE01154.1 hypothetical protein LS73_002455 [Helicobacter muridarum]